MPALAHRGQRRRTMNEINMVPFIDVMLVLLIIFMVTAPLIAPSVIELPSVGKGSKAPEQPIQILIRKDEGIDLKVADKVISVPLQDLKDTVKQAQGGNEETPVVIAADKNVKYEIVVNVMSTLQAAGVKRVGLSVNVTK
jgi:biopolymer transport protein TolR